MKKTMLLLTAFALLTIVSCDKISNLFNSKNPPLRIGYTEYSFDQAIAMVLKGILDQQPNLEVEMYRLPDSTMFRALADDELDMIISGWLPLTHQRLMDRYSYTLQRHSLICDSLGIYLVVPSYLPTDTMEDLQTMGITFLNTIIVPEQENAIYHFAKDIIDDYDLKGFTIQESNWDDIIPYISESLQKMTGFAFVTLRPHWIFKRYDIKVLRDTRRTFGQPESAYFIVNPAFPDRFPAIASFLSKMRFTLSDIETLLEANQALGSEPYENAMRWINQNANRINSWLVE